MNKMSYFAMGIVSLLLVGAGCQWNQRILVPPTPPATSTTATILVSTKNSIDYCNGADMDSEGYRKTLTKEQSITLPENQTESERVKAVIVASTSGMCQDVMKQLDITVKDGAVRIPAFGAWAGVSIVMCGCQPEIEVNALRLPGITKVQWGYGTSTDLY